MPFSSKPARRVAFGGILCALSLLSLFLSGIFPYAEYTCPALAGIFLMPLVSDYGRRTAWIAWGAISLLGFFVTPNKEAAALFFVFLGYYPILKSHLEQLRSRRAEIMVKLLIFNLAMLAAYGFLVLLLGMSELIKEMDIGLKYGIFLFWLAGNVIFLFYDLALSRIAWMYDLRIRPMLKHLR